MSRHQPVSPFERSLFHRKGSAGALDLGGLTVSNELAASRAFSDALQRASARPIGLASPAFDEAVYLPARAFLLNSRTGRAWWAIRTGGGGVPYRMLVERRTGFTTPTQVPDLGDLGYVDVLGLPSPVIEVPRNNLELWVLGGEDADVRVFEIPRGTAIRPTP